MNYDRQRPTLTELVNRLTAYSEIDYSIPAYELSRNEALLLLSELESKSSNEKVFKVPEAGYYRIGDQTVYLDADGSFKIKTPTQSGHSPETTPKVSGRDWWLSVVYDNATMAYDTKQEAIENAWMNDESNVIHVREVLDQDMETDSSPSNLQTEGESRDRLKLFEEAIQDIQYTLTNPCCIHKYPGSTFDDANMLDSIREIINGLDQDTETKASPSNLQTEGETLKDTFALRSFELSADLKKAEERIAELETQVESFKSIMSNDHNLIAKLTAENERLKGPVEWYCETCGKETPLLSNSDATDIKLRAYREVKDLEAKLKKEFDANFEMSANLEQQRERIQELEAALTDERGKHELTLARGRELTAENERLYQELGTAYKQDYYDANKRLATNIRDLEAKLKLATDALEKVDAHLEETWETMPDAYTLNDIVSDTLAKLRGEK